MPFRVFRLLGRQRGQSLVEFALLVPLLLLSLVGISDLGRVMYYYVAISNTSLEGARMAAKQSSTDSDVRSAVKAEAAPLIVIGDPDISVSPTPTRVEGQPVTVTVYYDFTALMPLVSQIWGGGPLRLQGATTMVVQ